MTLSAISRRLAGSSFLRRPPIRPSARAAARPAEVRSRIMARSNSLKAPTICKTRAAAEYVRAEVDAGRARRVGLVGSTAADVRDVMVCGQSGLLSICPSWSRPSTSQASG
jgi:hypothetical protein